MITTIIPCYNAELFLAEAIQSVLRQSRPADEIIVVDDCSTDQTRRIAGQYPVTLLQTPKNSGHATARNIGIRAAHGEVIAWLDADDYWEVNHLETVVGLLDRFPDADVAFSGVRRFGEVSNVWNSFPCLNHPVDVFEACAKETIVPAMSAVTRRDVLRRHDGFDEQIRVAPDFDLWLRLSLDAKFVATDEITSNYRIHSEQISSTKRDRQTSSIFQSRYRIWKQLQDIGDERRARHVREISLKKLKFALWAAWSEGQIDKLRQAISLADYVDGGRSLAKKYRWRLRLMELSPGITRVVNMVAGPARTKSTTVS